MIRTGIIILLIYLRNHIVHPEIYGVLEDSDLETDRDLIPNPWDFVIRAIRVPCMQIQQVQHM